MTCTNLPPRTGQQFSISHGDYHAVVTELGATLRKLTYQGEDIIVSPGPDDMVTCCHGQLLIPFPNRIENGEYTFEGKTYTLPIDEHERHNAIHGYGKRAFWKLVSLKEDAVTLSWRAPNMEGYPFDIVVTATYSLADDGLHLNISAYNNGDADAPWALAIHPWLANGFNGYGDEIDAHNAKCSLTVPGRTHSVLEPSFHCSRAESITLLLPHLISVTLSRFRCRFKISSRLLVSWVILMRRSLSRSMTNTSISRIILG